MSPDEIRTLFDYNAWANRRSLDAAEKLTGEQLTRQMGSSFSSVRDTLVHIYGAEWIWLERFQGHSPSALPHNIQFIDLQTLRNTSSVQPPRPLYFARRPMQSDLHRHNADRP